MSRPGKPLLALLACVLLLCLAARFAGVVQSEPTTGGEHELIHGIKKGKAPNSRFYAHAKQAEALTVIGLSPERAAFVSHLLWALAGLVMLVVAVRRLHGNGAAAAALFVVALSLIDTLYATRAMGLPHASASIAGAILCWTSRRKLWWVVGAVFLASAFAHRYHAGLLIVCFGVAVLWNDIAELRGDRRALWSRLLERAWVGAVAVIALVPWLLWVGHVYGRSEFSNLSGHENLSGDIVHHNLHFIRILLRNDPVVFAVLVASAIVVWRTRGGYVRRTLADHRESFVSPALLLRWALCFLVGLVLFRTFSGMTRQLAPALPLLFAVTAPVVATALAGIARKRQIAIVAVVAVVGAAVMALASYEMEVIRGTRYRGTKIKRAAMAHFPRTNVQMLKTDHFVWKTGGFKVIRDHRRVPDLILGGDRWFRFSVYEQEPVKLMRIRTRIRNFNLENTLDPVDTIGTRLYYIKPRKTKEELREFVETLPAAYQRAIRIGPGL